MQLFNQFNKAPLRISCEIKTLVYWTTTGSIGGIPGKEALWEGGNHSVLLCCSAILNWVFQKKKKKMTVFLEA